jgi:hypothetical protein
MMIMNFKNPPNQSIFYLCEYLLPFFFYKRGNHNSGFWDDMIYSYAHEYAVCLTSKAYIHFNSMFGIITRGIQKVDSIYVWDKKIYTRRFIQNIYTDKYKEIF